MAPKSSLLSHQPSKDDDEYDDYAASEEVEVEEQDESVAAVKESDSDDDSDSEDCAYLLKRVPKPSLKRSGNDEILLPDSKKKKPADDELLLPDSSSSKKKKKPADDDEILQDSSTSKNKKKKKAADDDETSSAKKKKKKAADGGRSGPGFISRVWSEDDEIAALEGMAKFKASDSNGTDFHSFMKGKLKLDFSKEQLSRKMSRFKQRFSDALKKGVNPVKPHEKLLFKLSKELWGNIYTGNDCLKEETHQDNIYVENEGGDFWSNYPNIAASLDYMKVNHPSLPVDVAKSLKEKLSSIGSAKANELDDMWKKVAVEQLQLDCKMLELMRDQLQVVLNK